MITGWQDVAAYGVIGIMGVAFLFILAGYVILVRQALRSPDRKRMLKSIFGGRENQDELDPRGRKLIYIGAAIGAVVFTILTIAVFAMTLR